MIEKKVVIHCSATDDGQFLDAEIIRQWHKAQGWNDIGYHFVIQPDGTIQYGRHLSVAGAHVKGHNENTLGVCMIGTKKFTTEAFTALRHVLDQLDHSMGLPLHNIWCHYEFDTAQAQKKSCPNMRVADLISWWAFETDDPIKKYLIEE